MAPSKTDSCVGVRIHSSLPKLLKFLLNDVYRPWDRFHGACSPSSAWDARPMHKGRVQVNKPNSFPGRTGLIRFLIPNIHNETETMPTNERGHHLSKSHMNLFRHREEKTITANELEVKRKSSKDR